MTAKENALVRKQFFISPSEVYTLTHSEFKRYIPKGNLTAFF